MRFTNEQQEAINRLEREITSHLEDYGSVEALRAVLWESISSIPNERINGQIYRILKLTSVYSKDSCSEARQEVEVAISVLRDIIEGEQMKNENMTVLPDPELQEDDPLVEVVDGGSDFPDPFIDGGNDFGTEQEDEEE